MKRDDAIELVQTELDEILEKVPPLNSMHEGYGVLLEEVEELFDEIKKKKAKRSLENVRNEAKQVAAVAIRIITDLT